MKITGHRTETVYRRYAIVATSDLRDAGTKLAALGDNFRSVWLQRQVVEIVKNWWAGTGLNRRHQDFQAVFLDQAGDGPKMVMDGTVAALWGGGTGWPGFAAVARGPLGARFIAPGAQGIRDIQAKHPFLKTLTVPAGSYPGQGAAIVSVGSWSLIIARPTLADDVTYRLALALHRGEAALSQRLAQARETTAANIAAAAPRPELIHPGVRRYLREIGLMH